MSAEVAVGVKSGVHRGWLSHGEEVAGLGRPWGTAGMEGRRQHALGAVPGLQATVPPSGTTMLVSVTHGSLMHPAWVLTPQSTQLP